MSTKTFIFHNVFIYNGTYQEKEGFSIENPSFHLTAYLPDNVHAHHQ